jgi:hypothetical protein
MLLKKKDPSVKLIKPVECFETGTNLFAGLQSNH